ADLLEYSRLRAEVAKRASAYQSRLSALKSERAPQEATHNNLKASLDSTEARLATVKADQVRLNERKRTLDERAQQVKQDRDDKRRALTTITAEKSTTARQRTELNEKLQDVLRKLIEADDGKQASRKEIKIQETIATLKRTYPGVRGRLHELCTPKQKKFQEAVGVVLGRHFDSVVVETEAIAKQCIEFLRDQRAGQATFIPLDTIQAKNTGSMKGLDAGVRLAIDTINFNPEYQRAVSYACGNAIVCDSLDVAKRMVYQKNIEAKAVTIDGTVIHKGGLITGGRGEKANTRRWDEAEVEKLIVIKDRIVGELEALPKERVRNAEEQTLQQDLKGLEAQLGELESEVEALQRNIVSREAEVKNTERQIKQDRPKASAEKAKLDEFDGEIEELAETVGAVEDDVFEAFCQRLGFENIGDYEARQGSLQQEAQRRKVEFITQKGKLEGQMNYERTQLQKRGIDDDLQAMKETLDELNATLEEAKEARSTVQNKLSKAKTELQQRSKKNEHVLKAISDTEMVVKRQAADRYSVLRRCKIENIKIPLLDGSESLDVLPITELAGDDQDAALQESISKLDEQLSKLTPNSHAAARLEAAEERLTSTDVEYKAAQSKYSKLSKEYNTVKDNRNELFNKAFSHISEQIGPIYANLTRSSEFPAGGQAYLTADSDEPYLAGINYTTMPPAKRFRDMEHLSGGEKTMAALALLFAIHSYQPSPFFVLDEVDAALDNANVQKLVRYVQEHAAPGMQFIVISLKTGFFQGSEALEIRMSAVTEALVYAAARDAAASSDELMHIAITLGGSHDAADDKQCLPMPPSDIALNGIQVQMMMVILIQL
ncbi:Structural maintenance of chromosomes protein 1, partial [Elasticomyces elasticus]